MLVFKDNELTMWSTVPTGVLIQKLLQSCFELSFSYLFVKLIELYRHRLVIQISLCCWKPEDGLFQNVCSFLLITSSAVQKQCWPNFTLLGKWIWRSLCCTMKAVKLTLMATRIVSTLSTAPFGIKGMQNIVYDKKKNPFYKA